MRSGRKSETTPCFGSTLGCNYTSPRGGGNHFLWNSPPLFFYSKTLVSIRLNPYNAFTILARVSYSKHQVDRRINLKKLNFCTLTFLFTMLALLVTGCGGGGGGNTSPEDGVFNTSKSFMVAWGKHNVSKAMSYVSPDYFESGMDWYDLRDAINGSSRFEVTGFKITTYDFDSDKLWCSAYVESFLDGERVAGWMYLHKRTGWMICGEDGRGQHTDSILPKLLKKLSGTPPPTAPIPETP